MNRSLLIFLTGIICLLAMSLQDNAPAAQKAKRMEGVNPRNCAACHGGTKVLPPGHGATDDAKGGDCAGCHTGAEKTLRGKLPLGHLHMLKDTGCNECHGEKRPFGAPGTDRCRECHGSPEEVEALTAGLEMNPHVSPHYGNNMDCDMCHHFHGKSENACSQCHDSITLTP